jgi:hypothetical protein
MYDTVVTEDGRLAIVLRIPYSERETREIHDTHEQIIIEYNEPEPDESGSPRVIIIDLNEEA